MSDGARAKLLLEALSKVYSSYPEDTQMVLLEAIRTLPEELQQQILIKP